ncbi:MAG: hypothetical protein JWP01_929 [Myxococcales bacterium]|jgi:hypothetical protein|nr:hypothetical protein [Myxococcales bacterium]
MKKFMDVHTGMHGVTQELLAQEHQKDLQIQDQEGVHFLHAWADPATGRGFCLSEGPNKEAVQRIHERAGHPADEIFEVSFEVE